MTRLRALGLALLTLVLLVLGAAAPAWADFPKVSDFPQTGAYQARLAGNKQDVALIELSGGYDRTTSDGATNVEPRTAVSKEFLRNYSDNYDFMVVFSTFEYNTGDALAFHLGVRNSVKGLGIEQYDNSVQFGSASVLQGYIDMAALTRYDNNPYSPGFDRVLQVFAHEFLHQWAAKVRFRNPDGSPNTGLLGKDGAHWSFLLDSGASVEYGNQWRDNGDGSFTSVANGQFYSPLDLYLMGMLKKQEVPPFYLIESPGADPTRLSENGVTIQGTKRPVTIDDIVAAEGPREPDADHAQKAFRLGFVLLSRPGETVTDAQVAAVAAMRKAILTRLGVLSGGRALVQSYLEPKAAAAPASAPGTPGAPRANAVPADGLAWLRGRQEAQGGWHDNPFTGMRDTAVALDALTDLDRANYGAAAVARALDWLKSQADSNTDYLARTVRALARGARTSEADAAAQRLLAAQNADNGWGVAPGYQSNPLDTALAIQALQSYDTGPTAVKVAAAAALLASQQNTDGGWGNVAGGVSRTAVTTNVMQALGGRSVAAAALPRSLDFLTGRQNPDGGFGDGASTAHDTANVMLVLMAQNALSSVRTADAAAYLGGSQQTDGSWGGSVYATALTVRVLSSVGLFNWIVTGLQAAPAQPKDGQPVVFSFKVGNAGTAAAPAGIARLYDGDPASGGTPVGPDLALPALNGGASVDLQILWNSFDRSGTHRFVLVVDPDNAVVEASKNDNRASLSLTVAPAPSGIELQVAASGVTVLPAHPARLPSTLAISAQVANIGAGDAGAVRVLLLEGEGAAARVIGEQQVHLLARSQQVVNFTATISKAAPAHFSVVIDPDGQVADTDRSNNIAEVVVEPAGALDLEVRPQDLGVTVNPVYKGSDARFSVKLRNNGTQDSPPFNVHYTVSNGNESAVLPAHTLQLAAGSSTSEDLVWRSTLAGQVTLRVEIDPDHVLTESDRSNNEASLPFEVLAADGPNLAVSFKDFSFSPDPVEEGRPLTLSQVVRNTGNAPANAVEAGFYDGDPATGGKRIGTLQTIATLAPGASATVSVQWDRFPDAADHLLFFSADPAKKLAEVTRDDNTAFVVASPLGMADVAVSSGDLVLTPGAPRPNEALDLAATVANLGRQALQQVVVRLYDGDPAAGGHAIGADQVIARLEQASQTVHFAVPASTGNAARTLFVVVDPDSRLQERTRTNNIARRDLVVQSGDMYVSEKAFSPNGDGIKDTVLFAFRLQQAADVAVQVVDGGNAVVRSYSGDGLTGVTSGSVSWDGRNQAGAVADDGDYRLRVVNAAGAVLGEVATQLDTNRSSVIAGIGTPFEHVTNLSCELPRAGATARLALDEEHLFFGAGDWPYSGGGNLWRASIDGGEHIALFPSAVASLGDWTGDSVSADGKKVAATRYFYDQPSKAYHTHIWVVDGDGTNARLLRDLRDQSLTGHLSADGSAFLARLGSEYGGYTYRRIPLDGTPETADTPWHDDTEADLEAWVPSPDGRLKARLVKLRPDGNDSDWNYQPRIEVQDSAGNPVFAANPGEGYAQPAWNHLGQRIQWLPDSRRFVFGYTFAFEYQGSGDTPAGEPVEPGYKGSQHVLMLGDVTTKSLAPIETTHIAVGFYEVLEDPASYRLTPDGRYVLREFRCCGIGATSLSAIDLSRSGQIKPLFANWSDTGGNSTQISIAAVAPSGRTLVIQSSRDADNPDSACSNSGPDLYAIGTLQNLTADLRLLRTTSGGGYTVSGTAADQNFVRYTLDYANADTPGDWHAIQPASDSAVVDAAFTTWVPPGHGRFLVRLKVEDAAGNVRERIQAVTWADTPSITDVYKESGYTSPNGDRTLDDFLLHYRVLEPVHLSFEVRDAKDKLVRQIARDHQDIGVDAVISWDGRDDQGRDVPEGQYRVLLGEYEFFVTIDRTLPTGTISIGPAEILMPSSDPSAPAYFVFAPALRWTAADHNLSRAGIESGQGAVPGGWQLFMETPAMSLNDGARVSLDTLRKGTQYRITVQDKAGNKTIIPSGLAPQELFVSGYKTRGSIQVADKEYDTVKADRKLQNVARELPLQLEVVDTRRGADRNVSVEYRIQGTETWTEHVLTALMPGDPSVTVSGFDHYVWDIPASRLSPEHSYDVRLKASTADGDVLRRPMYTLAPNQLKIVSMNNPLSPDGMVVLATTGVDAPIRIDLLLSSETDPRYQFPQVIDTVRNPPPEYRHMLPKAVVDLLDLKPCGKYKLTLQAYYARGVSRSSLPMNLIVPCNTVHWAVVTETAETCGGAAPGKLRIVMQPRPMDGRRLTQMLLGHLVNGQEVIVNNWNGIKADAEYTHVLDTSALPEGSLDYFVRVVDEAGEESTENITVAVVHDLPKARITAPADGALVCPTGRTKDGQPLLAIEGEAGASSAVSYQVESDGQALTMLCDGEKACPTIRAISRTDKHELSIPDAFLANYEFPGVAPLAGTLGQVVLRQDQAAHQSELPLTLRVMNAAGNNVCSAPVKVTVDAGVNHVAAVADRGMFSAAVAAPLNVVNVNLQPEEAVTVDIQVVDAAKTVMRTLVQGRTLLAGSTAMAWDGRGDGGELLADGDYTIRVHYKDGCANEADDLVPVTLDSHGPALGLASPVAGAKLGLVSAVMGTIADTHLAGWTLQFAQASAPANWLTIVRQDTTVPTGALPALLANWNTFGLNGAATLRLVARDSLGNTSTLDVPVTLVKRGDLLSQLAATPTLFSPNGDGRNDAAAISFTLLEPVRATLSVATAAQPDVALATLMQDQDIDAGATARNWDGLAGGKPLPDGDYIVRLKVTARDNSGTVQEETVALTLDATAPALAFATPLTSYASASGAATLNVGDSHLQSWQVQFGTGSAPASWQTAAQGVTAAQGAIVKLFEGLAEGKYALKASATDAAGNRSEVLHPVEIDNTPPKPHLSAPADAVYLRAVATPVSGNVEEKNPASWRLVLQAAGGAESELGQGVAQAAPAVLATLNPAAIGDGAYTLRLDAQDLAGQAASVRQTLVIDTTAPSAVISAPATGFVRAALDIAGTAKDTNLKEYRVEIAPGTVATAVRWSLLGSGTAPVEGGVLARLSGLPPDGVQTIRLTVTDKAGNSSTAFTEITVDTVPPAAPRGLAAKVDHKDVVLTWNASTEADLAGYNLYRDGVRLNEAPLTVLAWTDPALAAGSYSYTLTALDRAGNEGTGSAPAGAVVTDSQPTALLFNPANGALVSGVPDIRGTATAGVSFKEYRLSVGDGAAPADWQLLRRSPLGLIADVLGSLNTLGMAENSVHTLKLEAEDLAGQVARATVTFSVDNTAPAAPTQLAAAVSGAQVTLTWTPSPATDLAGYLVLRDGRVANAQGPVVGSLKPYLVVGTTWVDVDVPDGQHTYVVQAMDKAENLSLPSNPAPVVLDNRAPHALLTAPAAGARVDASAQLRATSPDTDIASLVFQYRVAGSAGWTTLATLAQAPYQTLWDASSLAEGDYQLQAVATDKTGHTDPAPTPLLVHRGNYAAPLLSTRVQGGTVQLSWSGSVSNVASYELERTDPDGSTVRLPVADPAATSSEDGGMSAGEYTYVLHVHTADGGAPIDSLPAVARVYLPTVIQPYTPTTAAAFDLVASAPAGGSAVLVRHGADGEVTLPVTVQADGRMTMAGIALADGENRFELVHTGADGNVSLPAAFRVVRGTPPGAPTGLVLERVDGMLNLSWTANPEADIRGYHASVDGVAAYDQMSLDWAGASSSAPGTDPYNVTCCDGTESWAPDAASGPLAGNWIEIDSGSDATLARVTVRWATGAAASDYDIAGWSGQEWVPLASVRGNAATEVVTSLAQPYLTNAVRIVLAGTPASAPRMTAVVLEGLRNEAGTEALLDTAPANAQVTLVAQNSLGLFGPAAARTEGQGDNAPPPVTLSATREDANVYLSWTASSARVVSYEIARDGQRLDTTVDTSYVDWATNGVHRYRVVAIDAAGNRSAPSNEIEVSVYSTPPSAPVALAALAGARGIALHWAMAPGDGNTWSFRVQRAASPGGPYATLVDRLAGTSYLDATGMPGTTYYYVVAAIDGPGNMSTLSNEASAAMTAPDTNAAPVFVSPTVAGLPFATRSSALDLGLFAAPGASVRLLRDGTALGTAVALAAPNLAAFDGVSPDRTLVVRPDGRVLLDTVDVPTLVDLASGSRTAIPSVQYTNLARWSHDGRRIALVDGNAASGLVVWNGSGEPEAVQAELEVFDLAWAPDDARLVLAARAPDGRQGVWLASLDDAPAQLLVSLDDAGLQYLSWSPDGRFVAWPDHAGGMRVATVADGSVRTVEGVHSSSRGHWSRDGARLLFTADRDGWAAPAVYDLASGAVTVLGTAGFDGYNPRWLTPETYAAVEDNRVVQRAVDGQFLALLAEDADWGSELEVTPEGQLFYWTVKRQAGRIDVPGSIRFANVALNNGANRFTARAGSGALAAPVDITLGNARQPNLSVATDGVEARSPQAGNTTAVTVTVSNDGEADAGAFSVAFSATDAAGHVTMLGTASLPGLVSGASLVASVGWTPAAAGGFHLSAVVQANADANPDDNVAAQDVTVIAPVPAAALAVTAVPSGRALALDWNAVAHPLVAAYTVMRASDAAGPFVPVAGPLPGPGYTDTGLVDGVTYYYQLGAVDEEGGVLSLSAVAAGTPRDTVALAPRFLMPAPGGTTFATASPALDLGGLAEPGSTVTLTRAGTQVDRVAALSAYTTTQLALPVGRSYGISANGARFLADDNQGKLLLVDTDSGAIVRTVANDYNTAALAADGSVAYATGVWYSTGTVFRYTPEDGSSRALSEFYGLQALTWSRDSRLLAVVGTADDGPRTLWLVDATSGARTALVPDVGNISGLSFAPDGSALAYIDNDETLHVRAVADGSELATLPGTVLFDWHPDSKHLLLAGPGPDRRYEIKALTLANAGLRTLVSSEAYYMSTLRHLGTDGNFVADAGDVYSVYGRDGRLQQALGNDLSAVWTTDMGQIVTNYNGGKRIDPPGLFRAKAMRLNEGSNDFGAYAVDSAGNRSPDALPLRISYTPAPLPDLAAGDNDVTVLPAAPVSGETVRVTAQVRNAGTAVASKVSAVLSMRDPQGVVTILARTLVQTLAAGASQPLTVDWTAPAPGAYSIVLTLDPDAEIAERNEFNNAGVRAVRVAAEASPALAVRTDAASYGGAAPVQGTVLLSNAGRTVSGTVRLRVEDAEGYLVSTLPEQDAGTLVTGQELSLAVSWNTGSYLAGNYRMVAELVDAAGVRLAVGQAGFAINAARQLEISLAADRAQYGAGQPVNLGASVRLASANAALDGASAQLEIRAADGSTVFTTTQALGSLLPGASAAVNASWTPGSAPAGTYTARVTVFAGTTALGNAQASFVLATSSTAASLGGDLQLAAETVANGDALRISYTLRNSGNAAMAALPVTVRIVDPATNADVAAVAATVDIAAGANATGAAQFAASGWRLVPLQVVLQASVDGQPLVLQRATLRVIDRLAPVVTIVSPAGGALVGGPDASAAVQVSDQESLVASVEYAVDGGPWRAAAVRSRNDGQYSVPLQTGDGPRSLHVRATDAFGNVSNDSVLEITLDNTAPQIAIAGVAEGASYDAPVVATIGVTDLHPGTSTATLDGAPYTAGTPVTAAGAHTLVVSAQDQAGNSAIRSVHFTVGAAQVSLSGTLQASPVEPQVGGSVALSGTVRAGASAPSGVVVEIHIVDAAGTQVFHTTDTVDLAANASWALDRSWTVAGPAGTSYHATLSATAGGQATVLAQAAFTAVPAPAVLELVHTAAQPQRILVLSTCRRTATASLGMCGAAQVVPDLASTMLVCDAGRVKAIDQYLDKLGVPHKTVSKEADFARELRTGVYSGYWISGGATKLHQPLTSELRNGLYLGESLIADGLHDLRPADQALNGLMGLRFSGQFAAGAVPPLSLSGKLFAPGDLSVKGDTFTLAGSESCTSEAELPRSASQAASVTWDADACGSAAPQGADAQACPAAGATEGASAGILSGTYGRGRTLLFGFDWEGAATAANADPRWTDVGRASFGWAQATPDAAGAVLAGDTVVRRTTLHNAGQGMGLTITAQLPPGAKLLESTPAAQVSTSAAGDLATWQLTLAGGADASFDLRLQAPAASGSYPLRYQVTGGDSATVVASLDVLLNVSDLAALGQAAAQAIDALNPADAAGQAARADALALVARARQAASAGSYGVALRAATTAQARLERAGSTGAPAQQLVARLVRAIERKM